MRTLLKSSSSIQLVVVFLGTNDCSLIKTSPAQHVPIVDYMKNLIRIISFIQSLNMTPLLINPPPLSPIQYPTSNLKERTQENTQKYANSCVATAK